MALTLTTLTGTIVQPDDTTPCHGSVVLTPGSGLIVSAADNRILAGELVVTLDDTGSFTVDLPSTDNNGTQPEPGTWNWTVRFKLLDAVIPPFSFALPASPTEVDLADVARVAPAPGTYLVVPGPAGPQGEKGDPGDIGAGALLAANNLTDLADTATARVNLGLGTAATQAATAFDAAGAATTAQATAEATAAADATTKAGTAQTNAITAAAADATAKVAAHTTAPDPHADRAFTTSAVTTHTSATDPHGDRAAAAADATTKANAAQSAATTAAATDAASKVTAHSGAADPHGDRSFATSAVTTHAGASDPHGDRADAATKYLPLAGGAIAGNLTVTGHALRAPQAADHGLRAWTFDPRFCGATAAVATAGTLFLSGLFITESFTATTLYWGVSVAPSSQTAGQNFVGLYDSTGNLLASVGVDGDTATTGLKTATINVAVTPGTYWVGFLFNATTAPQLPRCAGAGGTPSLINVGLTGANQLYASNGTGRTAMPSVITMSANTAATGYWAAIK